MLPIAQHRAEILQTISSSLVSIIMGDTGSGKSTQTPKYLFENTRQNNTKKKIVVLQPRRVAAVTLARRVLDELRQERGDELIEENLVSFAIGHDARLFPETRILYCTTGWLLQKIIHDSRWLEREVGHVLVDEVHERSVDGDLIMLMLKETLVRARADQAGGVGLRVVLMSATMEPELFQRYFAPCLDPGAVVPVVAVGGRCFPVQEYYLEDLPSHATVAAMRLPGADQRVIDRHCDAILQRFEPDGAVAIAPPLDEAIKGLAASLIAGLAREHEMDQREGCAVIVFCPGLKEIEDLHAMMVSMIDASRNLGPDDEDENGEGEDAARLEKRTYDAETHSIYGGLKIDMVVLHSSIDDQEQMRAFSEIPPGVTRVVLSTTIAESSVTLPFVRYVIDLGRHRAMVMDPKLKQPTLSTLWVSKSSANQRKGRAGRVCPGTVFRLFPRELFDAMLPVSVPEMLRLSLDVTMLRLLILAQDVDPASPFALPRSTISKVIQPPSARAITAAVEALCDVGAVTVDPLNPPDYYASDDPLQTGDDSKLSLCSVTALGRFLVKVPLRPDLGKLVALASRAPGETLAQAIVVACGLAAPELFVLPHPSSSNFDGFALLVSKTQRGRALCDGGLHSDALAVLRLYAVFLESLLPRGDGEDSVKRSAAAASELRQYGANVKRLRELRHTVSQVASTLAPLMPNRPELAGLAKNAHPLDTLACLGDLQSSLPLLTFLLTYNFCAANGLVRGDAKTSGVDFEVSTRVAAARVERTRCVKFKAPEHLAVEAELKRALPSSVAEAISAFRVGDYGFSAQKSQAQARKGASLLGKSFGSTSAYTAGALSQQYREVVLEFREDDDTREVNAAASEAGRLSVMSLPPHAMRTFISLFNRGELALSGGPRNTLLEPETAASVRWVLLSGDDKKSPTRDHHSLLAHLISRAGPQHVIAVPAAVSYFSFPDGKTGVRCERLTLVRDPGLLTLLLLSVASDKTVRDLSLDPETLKSLIRATPQTTPGCVMIRPAGADDEVEEEETPAALRTEQMLFSVGGVIRSLPFFADRSSSMFARKTVNLAAPLSCLVPGSEVMQTWRARLQGLLEQSLFGSEPEPWLTDDTIVALQSLVTMTKEEVQENARHLERDEEEEEEEEEDSNVAARATSSAAVAAAGIPTSSSKKGKGASGPASLFASSALTFAAAGADTSVSLLKAAIEAFDRGQPMIAATTASPSFGGVAAQGTPASSPAGFSFSLPEALAKGKDKDKDSSPGAVSSIFSKVSGFVFGSGVSPFKGSPAAPAQASSSTAAPSSAVKDDESVSSSDEPHDGDDPKEDDDFEEEATRFFYSGRAVPYETRPGRREVFYIDGKYPTYTEISDDDFDYDGDGGYDGFLSSSVCLPAVPTPSEVFGPGLEAAGARRRRTYRECVTMARTLVPKLSAIAEGRSASATSRVLEEMVELCEALCGARISLVNTTAVPAGQKTPERFSYAVKVDGQQVVPAGPASAKVHLAKFDCLSVALARLMVNRHGSN